MLQQIKAPQRRKCLGVEVKFLYLITILNQGNFKGNFTMTIWHNQKKTKWQKKKRKMFIVQILPANLR